MHRPTHWGSFADLATCGATYVRERYVQHGTIITAAGVSAGIDMALWLVQELADQATMQAVQLAIEYDPQPILPMVVPPTRHEDVAPQNWQVMQQRHDHSIRMQEQR